MLLCASAWLPLVKHREGMEVLALIKPLACFRLNCAQATERKGEELMPPGSSQHPSPPNLAQLVQAAGTGSLAPKLFQHILLTLLIPLCSPARPAVPLPEDGPEPANCTSKLPRVSITGLLSSAVILGTAGPCLAVWDRMVTGSIPRLFLFTVAC